MHVVAELKKKHFCHCAACFCVMSYVTLLYIYIKMQLYYLHLFTNRIIRKTYYCLRFILHALELGKLFLCST